LSNSHSDEKPEDVVAFSMRLQTLTIPMPEEVGKIYRSSAKGSLLGGAGPVSAIGELGQVSSVKSSGGWLARHFAGKSKRQVFCTVFGYLCILVLIINAILTVLGAGGSGPYEKLE
jgi:hypothetical protein